MTWTCALHPSDIYLAVMSGLCVGLTVGIWGGIELYKRIDVRRINSWSQEGGANEH